MLFIVIGFETEGRQAMNRLASSGGERCKFMDLTDLSELDAILDRISFVIKQRAAVIDI